MIQLASDIAEPFRELAQDIGVCSHDSVSEARPPRAGDRATCALCARPIEFSGVYWNHVGVKLRHRAVPSN